MIENRRDKERTKLGKLNGEITDPNSYFSLAGHRYCRGKDQGILRLAVYVTEGGICYKCKAHVPIWDFDLEHLVGGRKHDRCDCYHTMLADGRTVHTNVGIIHSMRSEHPCHRIKHHRQLHLGHSKSRQP